MRTPATPNHALQRTPGFGVQLPGAAFVRPAQSRAVLPAMKPGTARAFASRRCALMRAPGPESLSLGSLGVMARLLLLGGFLLTLLTGVTRAEDYFAPDYNGPKLPEDLLSTYARFVAAARKGDSETIRSLLLPGAVEVSAIAREADARELGADINLPFLRDGFSSALFRSHSEGASQFRLKTGTTTIYFAKLESVGWRIYHYIDKPIK